MEREEAGGERLRSTRLGVANAQFVTPRLAVGGDLSPRFSLARRQLADLVGAGVTHIVDLRQEWSDEQLVAAWHPELRYLHHRVDDAGQAIPAQWFEDLLEWVRQAWREPEARVLVHCHMGVNRAPSAVFGLLLAEGWAVREALTAIRAARPDAVIDYAQDALDWHLERTAAGPRERGSARRALTLWRRANHLDPEQVIRRIRSQESGGSSWLIVIDRTTTEAIAELPTGEPLAIWMAVDQEPDELAQLDEVLIWCEGEGGAEAEGGAPGGLVGVGLVVGPVTVRGDESGLWLPVLVRVFNRQPMVEPRDWPEVDEAIGGAGGLGGGRQGDVDQRLIRAPESLLAVLARR